MIQELRFMNNDKKYLGVDWGEVRIGLALGNSETKIANPLTTVSSLEEILSVIKDEEIDEVIIGRPLKMSNSKEEISKQYQNFFKKLKNKINIPIHEVDERLTSRQADKLVGDKKTKASRDEIAAMLILQQFLDTNLTNINTNKSK